MSDVKPAQGDVIFVLGMHRSGTSAVTGVLSRLGAALPVNLMAESASNELGHFESELIKEFDDELLLSAGSSWNDWRAFNPSWYGSSEARIFAEEAKKKFLADFGARPLVAFKDPRICRFAPFWLDVIANMGRRALAVIPVRSPLEVAMSLTERDRIPRSRALLLWLRHVLDAEADTRGIPRSIFRWDEFLTNWQFSAKKIADDLSVNWPRFSDKNKKQIDSFLSESLNHHSIDDGQMARHPEIHEWIVEAYRALLALVEDNSAKSALTALNQVRADFNKACELFGRSFVDFEDEVERERSVAIALRAEEQRWRAWDEEREKQVEAAKSDADVRIAALADEMRDALSGRGQRIEQLERDCEKLTVARKEKEKMVANLNGRLSVQAAEASAAIGFRDQKIADQETQIQTLQVTLAQAIKSGQRFQDQIAALRNDYERLRTQTAKGKS